MCKVEFIWTSSKTSQMAPEEFLLILHNYKFFHMYISKLNFSLHHCIQLKENNLVFRFLLYVNCEVT